MGLVNYTPLNDGTGIDASDVNTPFQDIYNEFNGNISDVNIANASISSSKMDNSGSVEQFRQDATVDFIVSGLGVTQSAGLIGAIAPGVCYLSGIRVSPIGNPSKTFTASKDTYVDLDAGGTLVFTEVTVGASPPALASGHFRLAKVITSGVAITEIKDHTNDGIDLDGVAGTGNVYSNHNPFGFTTVHVPTLQNSWDYSPDTYTPTFVAKDKSGYVRGSGLIRTGTTTVGTVLFTLPEEYRPSRNEMVPAATANTTNTVVLIVLPSGDVKIDGSSSGSWISLNSIDYWVSR